MKEGKTIPTVTQPDVLANAIMGKLYNVLTNGDATVPASTDNFFSWCTPGIPISAEDFRFLSQGLSGVVTPQAAATLVSATAGAATTGAAAGAPATPANAANGNSGGGLTQAQLDQLRAADTNQVYQQAEMLSRILDFVPDLTTINNKQFSSFSVDNNEGTLSDRYKFILTMSQVMDQDLDQATKDKIAKFRGLLQTTTTQTDLVTGAQTTVVGPSPMVQAYNTKMAAYDNAALAYNQARINALAGDDPAAVQTFAINGAILRNTVTAAMDDWIANGYKQDYEEIAAYINQVMGRDLAMLKQEYEQDLTNATLTGISSGSDFLYTALAPPDFATSAGWSRFTFSSGDFSQYSNSSFNKQGWSVSATAGFFGIGASGGASSNSSRAQFNSGFDLDTFSLTFSICEIPIIRAWFKDAFLLSKSWRFDQSNPDSKNQLVSDGGSPPTGYLPAYPTAVVFIKDLVLGIRQDSAAGQFITQQSASSQGGGVSIGLGPFSFGGSASHYSSSGYSSQNINSSWNDQGLSVPGMQIAGFKCHIFTSKLPNPDPSIKTWI
jgi:hypothetical protein